ncbi:hypothetical protein I4U23_014044 [Adineta vaga]|nr:hypothetical protein I4U23_014044 [Adineta vaga]
MNGNGHNCSNYGSSGGKNGWANGTYTSTTIWTSGNTFAYSELIGCACGKRSLSILPSTTACTTNTLLNSSEFQIVYLQNCTSSINSTRTFDIKCLGPLSFINSNVTINVTLYNCPLDCFFN